MNRIMPAIAISIAVSVLYAPCCNAQDTQPLEPMPVAEVGQFRKVFDQFQEICDQVCLAIVVEYNQMLRPGKEALDEQRLKQMADKASLEFMLKYRNAFVVSEAEAEAIRSGKYDTSKSRYEIQKCLDELANLPLAVALPLPIEYLVSQYNKQKLSDPELEFTARLLREYLAQQQ